MFRFTPPTHTMLAFKQALVELEDEGGVDKRAERWEYIIVSLTVCIKTAL